MPAKSKKNASANGEMLDNSDRVKPESVLEAQDILRGRLFQDKFPATIFGLDEQKR